MLRSVIGATKSPDFGSHGRFCDFEVALGNRYVVIGIFSVRRSQYTLIGSDVCVVTGTAVSDFSKVTVIHQSGHRACEARIFRTVNLGAVVNNNLRILPVNREVCFVDSDVIVVVFVVCRGQSIFICSGIFIRIRPAIHDTQIILAYQVGDCAIECRIGAAVSLVRGIHRDAYVLGVNRQGGCSGVYLIIRGSIVAGNADLIGANIVPFFAGQLIGDAVIRNVSDNIRRQIVRISVGLGDSHGLNAQQQRVIDSNYIVAILNRYCRHRILGIDFQIGIQILLCQFNIDNRTIIHCASLVILHLLRFGIRTQQVVVDCVAVLVHSTVELRCVGRVTSHGADFRRPAGERVGVLRGCCLGGRLAGIGGRLTISHFAALQFSTVVVYKLDGVFVDRAAELCRVGRVLSHTHDFR